MLNYGERENLRQLFQKFSLSIILIRRKNGGKNVFRRSLLKNNINVPNHINNINHNRSIFGNI